MPPAAGWEFEPHQDEALPPPKALADGKWDEKEPDQQLLCQQPHLALLALASLPGGRTEKPAPRGPTLEGHQGSRREGGRQRTSVAFFSFLERSRFQERLQLYFYQSLPTQLQIGIHSLSCSSSFPVNLSPKHNVNNTEAFFSCGS